MMAQDVSSDATIAERSTPGSFWANADRVAQLRELIEKGLTASQIARVMGAPSRNSVISKASRAGWRIGRRDNADKQASRIIGRIKARSGKPFPKAPKVPEMPTAPLPPASEYDKARLSFEELDQDGRQDCRWPVGDPRTAGDDKPLFCGEPQARGSKYCAVHFHRSRAAPIRPAQVGVTVSNVIEIKPESVSA